MAQNLWMWSDSYIGTVDPTTRLRKSDLFSAHNSLTILNQALPPGLGLRSAIRRRQHPVFCAGE